MATSLRRIATTALLASAFAAGPALRAQDGPDDLLKRTQALDAVAKQKIEAELKETFARVDRLGVVPALAELQRKREAISSELSITEASRRQLLSRIDEKIRLVKAGPQANPARPNLGPETAPEKRQAIASERERAERLAAERSDVRRSIETIEKLHKGGQTDQAKKEADALQKRHPANPAAIAFREGISMADRIEEAKEIYNRQKDGYLAAMKGVDVAAIMPKDDIEFDTVRKGHFKDITERRKVKLSAKEAALLKALDKPIDFSPRGKSFEDALQALSDQLGQPILVAKASLEAAGVESNTPVTMNLRNVQARTALRSLLQANNLTYIVKNDAIQVMTLEEARKTLTTRVYYLGDLAQGLGAFPGGATRWGPWVDQAQTADNVKHLTDMIKKIDPLSWRDEGGPGTVQFHWPSSAIIVHQTAEFHAKLGSVFGGR